jgi:methionyl-tRNA synthetase
LPKFAEKLSTYLQSNKQLPRSVRNFSLNFIKEGLKPRAVTRDVEWGIPAPFPGAEDKTIYVWIEAVLGYLSATIEHFIDSKFPDRWKEYWINEKAGTLFFIGKDNIPFHTIILPALLLATEEDYNLPSNVLATEFLQFKGEPFSKSRRIGISIDEALELFPAYYWRYFLMAIRPEAKDTNFSWGLFIEKVNSDLNDTLGNFIHRTLMFVSTRFDSKIPTPNRLDEDEEKTLTALKEKVGEIAKEIEEYKLQAAINDVIGISHMGNRWLNEKKPWEIIERNRDKAANTMYVAIQFVKAIAVTSSPFIPSVSAKLWKILKLPGNIHEQKWEEATKRVPADHKIAEPEPLFRKIDIDEKKLDETLLKIRQDVTKAN